MLWNNIYEFFIKHVFGGYYGGSLYNAYIGRVVASDGVFDNADTTYITFSLNNGAVSYTLGNYLSLLATIISIVIILVICCLFIKKMVSTISNLMSR